MTPIERVMAEVDDPGMRLLGAKILSLLDDIVGRGNRTGDNMTQLQRFSEMGNLGLSAHAMVEKYIEAQGS